MTNRELESPEGGAIGTKKSINMEPQSCISLFLFFFIISFPSRINKNIINLTMDLSWCIICDCHCVEDNIYCSEACRYQDTVGIGIKSSNVKSPKANTTTATPSQYDPFSYSYHHSYGRQKYSMITGNKLQVINQPFPHRFTPASLVESSSFADNT
ncbi:hypothetical protein BDB01DRAFT_778057 [Pilobolus umbonatus]|nr:hypothetical protein BDB01DRAFT_778057 [Pilobolus umbonatus]